MLVVKWSVVILLSLLSIILGGMAAAWRRACVRITRQVVGRATPQLVSLFTPGFVAQRQRWAPLLCCCAVVTAWVLFNWKVALLAFALTYTLMGLAQFLYPGPTNPYYVEQITADLRAWIQIHNRMGDEAEERSAQHRLQVIESAVRAGDLDS